MTGIARRNNFFVTREAFDKRLCFCQPPGDAAQFHPRSMKRILSRLALGLLVGLVVFLLGGAMYFDSVLKASVESGAPKLTLSDVRLDAVGFSLLTGSGRAVGFELGNPAGFQESSAFRCETTSLDLQPASLLGSKLVLNHLRLEAAEVTFEGTPDANNLQALLANVEAALSGSAGQPVAANARRLQVNEILISGAKVRVVASDTDGGAVTLALPDIRLSDLGTGPGGISGGELTQLVLKQIHEQTLAAVAADFTNRLLRIQANEVTNPPPAHPTNPPPGK